MSKLLTVIPIQLCLTDSFRMAAVENWSKGAVQRHAHYILYMLTIFLIQRMWFGWKK